MGKLLFKASDGGRFGMLREVRTLLNVNSGRGLGHKCFWYYKVRPEAFPNSLSMSVS
jgi:hypothetical protein